MGEMISEPEFVVRSSCPACAASLREARELFSMPFLSGTTRVLKCRDCGLVFKELCPTPRSLQKIYANDYVHFQKSGGKSGRADRNSAIARLARCRSLLRQEDLADKIRLLDV